MNPNKKASYIYCRDLGYWNENGLFVESTDGATGYRDEVLLKQDVLDLHFSDFTNGCISIVTFVTDGADIKSMKIQPSPAIQKISKTEHSSCHQAIP